VQLIIGTYTERLPFVDGKADGILTAGFDPASGRFGEVRTLAAARNPSYVAVSPTSSRVYAVCESETFESQRGGGVIAFAWDARSGELTSQNASPTMGVSPCHVALVHGGRFLVTANYGEDAGPVTANYGEDAGSVTVYQVGADGGLGDVTDHVVHTGSGPNAERQASSHAHMSASDPETGHILVSDLGADTIFVYEVGPAGRLTLARELKAEPGTGPRHMAFHQDGRHLFVVNELGGTVSVWRRDPAGFATVVSVSTVPVGADDDNLPAAIRISPSGRHVLVSNRGHDSIAVFRFDPSVSGLRLVGVTLTEGECPRDFILTPDGRRLVAASQDSDLLASYEFDDATGELRLLHRAAATTPVCLALA
jgi:6-phosphogluconolactonase